MIPAIIFAIGVLTRFWKFGHPLAVVFDEVHFGEFISNYWTGNYFFDIHPPFTRLIIAAFGYLNGLGGTHTDWTHIGNQLTAATASMRFIPSLAGALLPLVIYLICRQLNFSKYIAIAASLLICFENSLVVGSRFILQDSTILLGGFSGILFYLLSRGHKHKYLCIVISAVAVTLAVGSKWIGASYLAVIFTLELYKLIEKRGASFSKSVIQPITKFVGIYLGIIAVLYFSVCVIHLSILTKTGSGDAFQSAGFQKTLIGNRYYDDPDVQPAGLVSKFLDMTKANFLSQKNQTFNHPYSTKWYTWPLMERGIYYWHSDEDKEYIYFLGNPLIYWLGTLSVLLLIIYCLNLLIKRAPMPLRLRYPIFFILFGYMINFLPFGLISRPMFLYHYAGALVFSIIAIAYLIDQIADKRKKHITAGVLVAVAFVLFIYFSPLTYGTPALTKSQLDSRMWLSSWR